MKVADLFALLSLRTDKKSFDKTKAVINGVKSQLKRVAVAGGIATVAIGKMIADTAASADQFAKMSKQIGISVEGLQQLEFAAGISGTNLAVLRTGLQRFARTLDDAGQGLKTAQEPFKRLGINTKDADGNLKSLDVVLGDMADKFKDLPAGPEKTALAMKTFGRAGAQLIPLLDEGSEGIAALRAEFTSLGAEITTEQAKSFEEYNDTILRIKTTLIGFRNQAVIALLPHLKNATKEFFTWVKANKELIKQNLAKFMRVVVKALIVLGKAIGFIIANGEKMLRFWIAWKVAIFAVGTAMQLASAGGVVAALRLAAAWAAAALPFILLALLVAALALVVEDFVSFLQGKESVIGTLWEIVVERWRAALMDFFEWLERKFNNIALVADDFISFVTGKESKREKRNRKLAEPFQGSLTVKKRQEAAEAREARLNAEFLNEPSLDDVFLGPPAPSLKVDPRTGIPALPEDSPFGRGSGPGGGVSLQQTVNITTGANPEETQNAVEQALKAAARDLGVTQ